MVETQVTNPPVCPEKLWTESSACTRAKIRQASICEPLPPSARKLWCAIQRSHASCQCCSLETNQIFQTTNRIWTVCLDCEGPRCRWKNKQQKKHITRNCLSGVRKVSSLCMYCPPPAYWWLHPQGFCPWRCHSRKPESEGLRRWCSNNLRL